MLFSGISIIRFPQHAASFYQLEKYNCLFRQQIYLADI